MGEIADMIIDGTLCEDCSGLVVSVDSQEGLDKLPSSVVSPGYPRKCEACAELAVKKEQND